MSKIHINAFPISKDSDYNGMELRDYFAAKALQGLLSTANDKFKLASEIIELSYNIADAMMKEREK